MKKTQDMERASSQTTPKVAFFNLPLELRQMIYGHVLEMEPKEIRAACKRACLDCRLKHCPAGCHWISVTQLSNLLQLLPPTELTSMPLFSRTKHSILCYDGARNLSRNHQGQYLRPWSVTFQRHDGRLDYRCLATRWEEDVGTCVAIPWIENVAGCVEAFCGASKRKKESLLPKSTLSRLLADIADCHLSSEWLILSFFLALVLYSLSKV